MTDSTFTSLYLSFLAAHCHTLVHIKHTFVPSTKLHCKIMLQKKVKDHSYCTWVNFIRRTMGSGPNVTLTKMYMITFVYQGHAIGTY